ncbi:hypothetical protein U1839_22525 [Sphingomonas sp. RT2P30]|uniref:hypothetical protein n=1 Tax=Parasphingomonas halimpatiens TaxID=3096162 RepID=UPI002FCC14F0
MAIIIGLQLLIINKVTLGPQWLAPALELALLAPLSIATAWTQGQARDATTDHHWRSIARQRRVIRLFAVVMTAIITLMNFWALVLLLKALLAGHSGESGQTLLLDAVNIWATNVIIFALWFWSIDRGGPAARGVTRKEMDDFLFPQMTLAKFAGNWSPGFVDYLFLSFTNATAFSPTDTMPLTPRAKILMMAESFVSLLTIALVAARAVNILA